LRKHKVGRQSLADKPEGERENALIRLEEGLAMWAYDVVPDYRI
jgi:hypothetical protein